MLLATPAVWLLAGSLLLALHPVTVASAAVWLVAVLWVGNLVIGLARAYRRRPATWEQPDRDEAGVAVSPEEQPELWALVREAAGAAGLREPLELRLTAVGQVAAWDRERTRLDVGVPLLFVLDRPAIAALVARALSVVESGWADVSVPVDRLRGVLQGVSGHQLPSGVARRLLLRLDRQRAEGLLEADDVATRVAGRATAGRALGQAYAVHAATLWWFDEYVLPELLDEEQPRPLLPGLEALLCDPVRQSELSRSVRHGLPAADDIVPGLADRVLGLLTGTGAEADLADASAEERPAADLLKSPSTVLELVAEASLGTTRRPRTWSQALESWAERTSRSSAVILTTRAGHDADLGTDPGADLGSVLEGVAAGRLAGWVRVAVRGAAVDTDELGHFLLTGLLAHALVASGAGSMSADWSGAIDVVDHDGARLEVPRAARLVVDDPALVPDLRTMLEDLGVPLGHRPAAGDARPGFPLLALGRGGGPRRVPGTGFPGLALPS